MINRLVLFILTCLICFTSCSSPKNGFRVAATPVPHAEMLEFIKPDLEEQGIHLVIVVTEDYNIPNRALADKEVAANFFQHTPFMDAQIKQFGYSIESLAKIEIEPMGIYSKSLKSLSDLKTHDKISIPNDPSNEGRALLLLHKEGIIQLDDPNNLFATPANIVSNPKKLDFIEIDSAMLPRTLQDVAAAVINTNYALEANLNPLKDALALESLDSPYANIIAVRKGESQMSEIEALKMAMTSDKMRQFILEKYKGSVIPAF